MSDEVLHTTPLRFSPHPPAPRAQVLARDEPAIMVNVVDPGYCATDQNQNSGHVSAERGATTPALLAALPPAQFASGGLYLEERLIAWACE